MQGKGSNGLSEAVGDGGASDDRLGINLSTVTNVKEKKAASGWKQWCADKCSTTGSIKTRKALICSVCRFLWCKDFRYG